MTHDAFQTACSAQWQDAFELFNVSRLKENERSIVWLFFEARKAAYLQMKYHNMTAENHIEVSTFIHYGHTYSNYGFASSLYRKLLLDIPDLMVSSKVVNTFCKPSLAYGDTLNHVDLFSLYQLCYPYLTMIDVNNVVFPLSTPFFRFIEKMCYERKDQIDAGHKAIFDQYTKRSEEDAHQFYQRRLNRIGTFVDFLTKIDDPLLATSLNMILTPNVLFDVFYFGESNEGIGEKKPTVLCKQIEELKLNFVSQFDIKAHQRAVELKTLADSLFFITHIDCIINTIYNQELISGWLAEENYLPGTYHHLTDEQLGKIAYLKSDWDF